MNSFEGDSQEVQRGTEMQNTSSDDVQQTTTGTLRRYYCFIGCQHIALADWYPLLPWDQVLHRARELEEVGPSVARVVDAAGAVLETRLVLDLGWDKVCAFCLDEDEGAERVQAQEILGGEWAAELDSDADITAVKPEDSDELKF